MIKKRIPAVLHNEAAPCLVPVALGVLLHIITQARVTWPPSPPWCASPPPPSPPWCAPLPLPLPGVTLPLPLEPLNPPAVCLFRPPYPAGDLLKLFSLNAIHDSHLLPLYFTLLIVLVYLDHPLLSPSLLFFPLFLLS